MSNQLQSLASVLDRLDVEQPTAMRAALSVWNAVNAAGAGDPMAGLADRVARLQITEKEAAKAVSAAALGLTAQQQARTVAQNLDRAFKQAAAAVASGTGDEIIVAMRPAFDRDIDVLGVSVAMFGPTPDIATVRTGGEALAAQYGRWTEAVQRLQHVDRARRFLAQLGYDPRHPERCVEWYAPRVDDLVQLAAAEAAFRVQGDALTQLCACGLTPVLNTATEAGTVAAAAHHEALVRDAEAAARKRAAGEQRKEQYRQAWAAGSIIPNEPDEGVA